MKNFKIVQLRAENFKRLKAVEINPDGSVVIVRGENGAGKSSVIDAIWAALGGKKACPDEPIRKGEDKAVVSLDLGDLIVTRTFTPKDSYLSLRNKDGASLADPQKMLDGMIGAVGFDPFDFARKTPKEQAKMLAQVAGLDFAAINAERKVLYEQRTEVNREVKRFDALVSQKDLELEGYDPDLFTELTSIDAVIAEQKAAQNEHETYWHLKRDQTLRESEIQRTRDAIARLTSELTNLEALRDNAQKKIEQLESNLPDLAAIDDKLRSVNDHNDRVRAFAELRSLSAQYREAAKQADDLTAKLEAIDKQKQLQIEKAQLPIDGLLFDENGIYLNGIPFEQCCASEQLKISVALAMKLNPQIRVIRILDGSLLDSKSMAVVRELAEENDFQVWIEVVDESKDGPGVLIQDGSVIQ